MFSVRSRSEEGGERTLELRRGMTFSWLMSQSSTSSLSVNSPCGDGDSIRMQCGANVMMIIIKRISRVPIYCTRWEHRVLYNNTNNIHTNTHTPVSDGGIGTAVKNSLETVIDESPFILSIFTTCMKMIWV